MEANHFLKKGLHITLAGILLVMFAGCSHVEQSVEQSDDESPEGVEQSDDTSSEGKVEVGYGTQDEEDVTGSLSSLSSEEVASVVDRGSITHVEELLQGRVAGVHVFRTAAGGFAVRIRGISSLHGSNEPLYVVDGTPIVPPPGRGLIGINPQDIETIDVIKDGTSAIYGSRGANGVVIITTKRAH